jgi:hypothetical protein
MLHNGLSSASLRYQIPGTVRKLKSCVSLRSVYRLFYSMLTLECQKETTFFIPCIMNLFTNSYQHQQKHNSVYYVFY